MDIQYLVNRNSVSDASVMVDYMGQQIEAKVPQIEVELVDPTGQHGSLTLRFRSLADRAVGEQFAQGSTVTITVTPPAPQL